MVNRKLIQDMAKMVGILVLVIGLMVNIRALEFLGLGLLVVAVVISQMARRSTH